VPYHFVGTLNEWDEIRVTRNAKRVLREKRVDLQRAWSETSYQMQTLRDNPDCAKQEFDRILDVTDPGLTPKVTFDAQEDFTRSICKWATGRVLPSCASRASTAITKWLPLSTRPALLRSTSI
jgi:hypothetical protein